MSRKKPSHRSQPRNRSVQPDPQPQRTSAASIVLTAALAAIVTTLVMAQAFSPRSMPSAILRTEASNLQWDGPVSRLRAALQKDPRVTNRIAVDQLMKWLNAAVRGRREIDQAVSTGGQFLRSDPDNLVARLCQATLLDLQATSNSAAAREAIQRFEQFSEVVDGQSPPTRATLYNTGLSKLWQGVLEEHFSRPDVAVSQAGYVPYVEIGDSMVGPISIHFAALPYIQLRLCGLADELRAQGRPDAADTCLRWIADLSLGLIDTETDVGTRLLGADLLARACRAMPPSESPDAPAQAARQLEMMRTDFHAGAQAAPVDVCDQSFTSHRAVNPVAYKAAFHRLVFAGVLVLFALGAAALFFATLVGMAVKAALRRANDQAPSEKSLPSYVKPVIALLPSFAVALLAVANVSEHGPYSSGWGLITAVAAITAGALVAIVVAGITTKQAPPRARLRLGITALLALAPILLIAVPSPITTRGHRWLDLAVGATWVFVVLAVGLVFAGVLLSSARLRTIASVAALAWCLSIGASFVAYQFHRQADRRYQQTVVAGRQDEITARLGPNWQDEYLTPTRLVFRDKRD